MKKCFNFMLALSLITYFSSGLMFPLLGENVVVPIQIVSLLVGIISLIGLMVDLFKRNKQNRQK